MSIADPQAPTESPGPGEPSEVFAEFCAAGLWPGLGRTLAGRLAESGITGPEQVSAGRLELLPGVGPKRALRLAAAFEDARPAYETARLLMSCRVPARFAGPAVGYLGSVAAARLRKDPWLLLSLPQIRPDQADWFARKLLGDGASPQDPRRGRALVAYLLARAARDGHTAVPAEVIVQALGRFRVRDTAVAIEAAVDEGTVLPFEAAEELADEPEEGSGPDSGPQPGAGGQEPGADRQESGAGGQESGPGGQEPGAGGQESGADRQESGPGGQEPGADRQESGADGGLLALARYAMAEDAVAEGLARLAATAQPLREPRTARRGGGDDEAPDGAGDGDLDEAQRGAVATVASHGVCVLAGGPGTGKSRTVAAVVLLAAGRGLRVALAAPTGRAAKRLEELTGAPATTLHRLLGAQGRGRAGEAGGQALSAPGAGAAGSAGSGSEPAWIFTRCEEWPLDADLVVVDESSMLDAELAAALVEACADGTRLLLVGDPAQLPSIGPGRVLADIIDSGTVPVTELTTLYRQREGGVIARLATAVRSGKLPPMDAARPDRGKPGQEPPEAVVVPVRGSQQAARRVVQLVTDSIPRALGIGAGDIQVVTPVHKGPAGTMELNRVLKEQLNPGPGAHGGFDPGDRVVAIANHADEGFTNGEVGTVTGPADDGLTVMFTGAPVTVPAKLLSDLRHGWAMTVHRAQGSEWPAVVAVFPAEATGMLSRPLVYTALTRAQRHLSVVHGAGPALARAVRTVGERPRQTRLATLLH